MTMDENTPVDVQMVVCDGCDQTIETTGSLVVYIQDGIRPGYRRPGYICQRCRDHAPIWMNIIGRLVGTGTITIGNDRSTVTVNNQEDINITSTTGPVVDHVSCEQDGDRG